MNSKLRLAITSIGDLLINNKISKDITGKAIENIELTIPNYQRPYKWTSKNVIQLLDDIIIAKNKNKESYRVGTLILHQDSSTGKFNIVDGQQRTITFSILLKVLGEGPINFLNQNLSSNSHNRKNIPSNYRAYERRILNYNNKREKQELVDYIKNNCEIIVVITKDISEAFQFFDSQNARGKKLYPHDLLKAYHLREMSGLEETETEKIVKSWEDMPQENLSILFSNYLYRIKEWIKGNKSYELNEHNIHKFKGVTRNDNFPYAQFYKGAYAYADMTNNSPMPLVSGIRNFNPFQLETPIVAGKPFFDYAKHYYEILKDIQDNSKYEGYFINDIDIVKTLDLVKYKNGVGNRITRLLFDTSILLYVDRFCPTERPGEKDLSLLNQFVIFAFIWAYSLRAQYYNLGWQSAQNYILGNDEIHNSMNLYKIISNSESPAILLSLLADKILPLPIDSIVANRENLELSDDEGIFQNYLYYFNKNRFIV